MAFLHTSVREYFYDRLATERLAHLHRRAEWYERQGIPDEAEYHRARA